ncbi:MAG: hypothetical protein IBJ15_02070 [Alphaproteobacteria bacterium]|nr:hypothetical protein [Alphaproteobacteria bacterium]
MNTILVLRAGETRAMRVLLAGAAAVAILAPSNVANAQAARASRDIVAEIGQWIVDAKGARHRSPVQAVSVSYATPLVAVADAGPPATPAWRARQAGYDRHGNPPFELAAPPPRADAIAAAIAQVPPVPKSAAASGTIAPAMAAQTDTGEPAAQIEARVNARLEAERRTMASAPNPLPNALAIPNPDAPPPARGPLLAFGFAPDSAEIDPELAAEIRAIAQGGWRTVAVGYAPSDAGGSNRALRLAESRALALRQELISRGAPAAAVAFEARIARESGDGGHRGAVEREAVPVIAPAIANNMRPIPAPALATKPAARAAPVPVAPPRRANART